MPGVLVVESDIVFGSRMVRALTIAGFHPLLAKNAANALCLARRAEPESFLIAWCLGQPMNGPTLTRRLRKLPLSADRPIILMSGLMKTPEDEADALKAGADLFWAKDIAQSEELFRHIRAFQLARPANRDIRLGEILLRPGCLQLEIGGKTVSLRAKELALMRLFLKRPGVVISGDYLWESVWGEENLHTGGWRHTLNNTMAGTDTYRHAIGSRHAEDRNDGNALDFFLWTSTAQPAAIGSSRAMSIESSMALSSGSVHIHPVGRPDFELVVSDGLQTGRGIIHRKGSATPSLRSLKRDVVALTEEASRLAYAQAKTLKHVSFVYKGDPRKTARRGLLYEEAPETVRGPGDTLSVNERLAQAELALQELDRRLAAAEAAVTEAGTRGR